MPSAFFAEFISFHIELSEIFHNPLDYFTSAWIFHFYILRETFFCFYLLRGGGGPSPLAMVEEGLFKQSSLEGKANGTSGTTFPTVWRL